MRPPSPAPCPAVAPPSGATRPPSRSPPSPSHLFGRCAAVGCQYRDREHGVAELASMYRGLSELGREMLCWR
ncbi:hypothetical protein ACP70R_012079 [Stipagrostis hirtigluma subsp. patula]